MLILPNRMPEKLEMPCHAYDKVLLMADRYQRAIVPHQVWAAGAKQAVDMVEGKQWSEAELRALEAEDRPAFVFNKLNRLVRLVLGYHRNNRTDLKVMPGLDGSGAAATAQVLTKLAKNISETDQLPYVDTEVFMDGMLGGRAYYDYRLNFDHNDLGDIKVRAADPASVILDPDGVTYDLNESCTFMDEERWVSIEEVEFLYGKTAASLLWPLVGRVGGYAGGVPMDIQDYAETITPWRGFGGGAGGPLGTGYMGVEAYMANSYDPARKTIRLIECQHIIRQIMWHFVDLETGDRQPVPFNWTGEQIQKVMWYCEQKYAARGQTCPIRLAKRPGKRYRWTVMCGDLIVYDDWSAYESYTFVPFFPWFRRGRTRGMLDDLLDPQREYNKRRNSEIDIVVRSAHAGWMYHKDGVTEEGKQTIEEHGAAPGINIEWKGEVHMKPTKIEPSAPPTAMEKLERKASEDMLDIAGINESALGELDRVQSGRAIEARQRQAVLAIQVYMDNMSRTKELGGRKLIQMIQNHYTEQRVFRVIGADGAQTLEKINARNAAGEIVNDVTVGKYTVTLDETPLASSYLQAQFDEMMQMIEKGVLPIPAVQDIIVDASTIPQKDIVKIRIKALQAAAGIPTGDALETPEGQAQFANAIASGAMGAAPGGGAPGATGPASIVGANQPPAAAPTPAGAMNG